MGPRHMDYSSPRGVHVAETYDDYDDDPYHRDSAVPPRRKNRYSRSVYQTPRTRDATWISSPEPVGSQTPGDSRRTSPLPWLPPQLAPSSPGFRPAGAAPRPPPSPAPTVGEHMAVDDIIFPNDPVDPYRPQHKRSRSLLKSFWHGLRKLSGHAYQPPYMSQSGSYISQTMEVPAPGMSDPSDATQYIHPTPPESDERSTAPYSPYARRSNLGATSAIISASLHPGSPVPSMKIPSPSSAAVHIVPPTSLRASPVPSMRVASPRGGASPIIPPGSVRVPSVASSSAPASSIDIAPPITIVSPSDSVPPSPLRSSIRSNRLASPVVGMPRHPAVAMQEPVRPASVSPFEDGSQTLHDHMPMVPPVETQFFSAPTDRIRFPEGPKVAFNEPLSPKGSFASTLARMRRLVEGLEGLPWVSEEQIANEYVPSQTPRSRLRERVRKGADPSWYNERPEATERRPYLSEWDMWAMQSAAELWGEQGGHPGWGVGAGVGVPGQWGVTYPHGYVPAQPVVIPPGYPPPGLVG